MLLRISVVCARYFTDIHCLLCFLLVWTKSCLLTACEYDIVGWSCDWHAQLLVLDAAGADLAVLQGSSNGNGPGVRLRSQTQAW